MSISIKTIETNSMDDPDIKMSSQEAHHLLKIFPLEVWNIIAKYLDTNSLICLLNSSQFFRQFLLKKRVEYLIQPVLKILTPYLLQYFNISSEDYVYPKNFKFTPLKSFIYTTRLVCRSWNKAIQELSSTINFEDNGRLPPGKPYIMNYLISHCYHLSSANKSCDFLKKFSKSHAPTKSNPFLSRRLFIMGPLENDEDGEPQVFFTQIPQILKIYGHHLWKLDFKFTWNFASELEQHSKLVELLSYLPNLRNLVIISKYCLLGYRGLALQTISFPNLPNLKKLECHDWRKLSFNMFVRQNPQITQLTIFRDTHRYRYNLSPLVNLETLNIDVFSPYDQQFTFGNPQLTFPLLRKLRLHYRANATGTTDLKFVRWSSVFQMLSQKFGENEHLDYLKLLLPNAETEEEKRSILEDSLNERLVLKNLKSLKLIFYESTASIDFLLGVKETLEELKLKLEFEEEAQENTKSIQIINFVGYTSKMMESNIWNLFPALRKIELGMCDYAEVYTRE